MSDDAEQTPKAPTPTPGAPSPRSFARPATPQAGPPGAPADGTADQPSAGDSSGDSGDIAGSARFASTGDPRVDRALAQLPDPEEHRLDSDRAPARDAPGGDAGQTEGDTHDDTQDDTTTGIDLPDPGLLDAHLADVTSVHRQLQQRLSDLSG